MADKRKLELWAVYDYLEGKVLRRKYAGTLINFTAVVSGVDIAIGKIILDVMYNCDTYCMTYYTTYSIQSLMKLYTIER